ncbi:hypothetical protein OUZ56_003350 [Daphnia magna]|uniref:Uncharacterized protein n=1 Tax=Daphnia magna TaxID=35525 RepID=A0ABR0A8Q1_9CRUS|nr:hypothetical protein OUZ56_003350 [Daphnia magna]
MASASTRGKIITAAIADIGHQEGSAWQRLWRPTQSLQLQHTLQVDFDNPQQIYNEGEINQEKISGGRSRRIKKSFPWFKRYGRTETN